MAMRPLPVFHLSFPVLDLESTERWYVDGLGCRRGRRSAEALVLGLGGHQLVAHRVNRPPEPQAGIYPRHFGLIFSERAELEQLEARARAAVLRFAAPAKTRFPGTPLEHRSLFLIDPSGNWLEFKHYRDPEAVTGHGDIETVGEADAEAEHPHHSKAG